MRVGIYARVSLDERSDDRRFQDVENQLIPCRDFCKAMGYEVVKEYTDKVSGGTPNRPGFREMMKDAIHRRIDGIVVWRLDRFSREKTLNTIAYVKQLRDRGVWLKSMMEGWFDTSQSGIADVILAMMAWMSEEERRKISDRTRAGIQRRKNIGQWHGGRPRKKGNPVLDNRQSE